MYCYLLLNGVLSLLVFCGFVLLFGCLLLLVSVCFVGLGCKLVVILFTCFLWVLLGLGVCCLLYVGFPGFIVFACCDDLVTFRGFG